MPFPLPSEMAIDHPARRGAPAKLFVEVTTRCNLNCFMCVKQNGAHAMNEGDLSLELFSRLTPALAGVEALVLNGIGEPLLRPDLEDFIRHAKRQMPADSWIGFQSNGQLLTNLRASSLIDAGLDRICLSMDAALPATFQRVREGGELADIEHAFRALRRAKKQCQRPGVRIGIEFVAMRSNLDELPSALRWAAEQGADFAIITHLLPYSDQHAVEAAYSTCSAQSMELFNRYRTIADGQGLDIYRYLEARWKYTRSAEEQRLVKLVEEMKQEADRSNLFTDMKRLLQMDPHWSDRVATVFNETTSVAEQLGLELRLPAIALQEQRHCSFIEEGGAFVSWDGNVSPCYFLWHRYSCFASGWHQEVQPKVFGNLQQQGILEIWNSPAYRTFREQVVGYDYPTCVNCTLAPCDYVQTNEFVQDCHIREVPCGACLWCMGVFHCLK
ncbi:tungsten-containing aldehyde ferredoxin oxidoreductase cofactor-modifying protein [Geobacter sp. OR-1]|uniref:radical SAM/SPASM domain-containing protein n=1 Tax=Geobacter sp. OR-1 TaxID=1266765 RepID=UPI0005436DEC|nr:radical SAM/SPASM domain-containing protein [Geobacter sp. OR-1]GAM07737.1 tungsten-containing aldehyde ferredoxin oxidoreductase cofactor-modifying protein [Geobacter sp. OR-1]